MESGMYMTFREVNAPDRCWQSVWEDREAGSMGWERAFSTYVANVRTLSASVSSHTCTRSANPHRELSLHFCPIILICSPCKLTNPSLLCKAEQFWGQDETRYIKGLMKGSIWRVNRLVLWAKCVSSNAKWKQLKGLHGLYSTNGPLYVCEYFV